MSKHSKKKTNPGTIIFVLVMVVAVVAAVISLLGGKTVNSDVNTGTAVTQPDKPANTEKEPEAEPSTESEPQIASTIGSSAISTIQDPGTAAEPETPSEPIVDANGDRLVFGQVPQSTENADPNEPDITATEPPKTEEPANTGDPAKTEAPAQTEEPPTTEEPAATSVPQLPTTEPETPTTTVSGNIVTTTTVTNDWLILANKTHHLSEDYWPSDMVTVSSCVEGVGNNDTKKLRKVAADALEELIQGAADAGYKIKMRTGFRSYGYQASLFQSYVNKNGEAAANKYSARAGESEHQTGLCCDVSSPSVSWGLSYQYGDTDEGKWLAQHCHEYGFIVRYLQGKEDITGYVYEPWHIRYVGIDVATEIFNKGICFEEYLGETN